MAKKYIWLKLQNDFFKRKEIKKLRKLAGGAVYTVIYLEMQLLSLENNGKLYFEGVEDNFIDEIALTLDESVEDVQMTMLFLQKHGLIETGEETDEYILPDVVVNIGSETASAERKRQQRLREKEKKKSLSDNVTPKSLSVTKSHTEKEKDIEKDIDKDIEIEEEKEVKVLPLSSLSFEGKINHLKKIILRSTLCNAYQLSLVFRPAQYKSFIDELLINIYESDYLMGKIVGKYPNLQTFTVESQINRILAGFYKTHDKKNESKTVDVADVQYAKREDFIEF